MRKNIKNIDNGTDSLIESCNNIMGIKKILLEYTQNYKSNYYSKIKSDYPDVLKEIEERYNYKTFAEKLYNYIYGDDVGICPNCGKKCGFLSINRGYRQVCSNKCLHESGIQITNMRKTMIEKYGTNNSNIIPGIKEKIRETNLKKYGEVSCMKLQKYKDLAKKSCFERYGAESPMHVEKFREKIKQTFIKKYGVEHALQNKDIRQKQIQTMKEKYGVEHYSQTSEYKEKVNNTMMERYGTTNWREIDGIEERIRNTFKSNFYNKILLPKLKSNNITPLFTSNEYTVTNNYYNFKCDICDTKFKSMLTHGRVPKCTHCHPQNESDFENEIIEYISSVYKGTILHHDRSILSDKHFEIDIFLPDEKIAFECDGIYWHSEKAGKDDEYHLRKTIECEEKDVHLIHIFESDWANNSESVKLFINELLNIKNDKLINENNLIITEYKNVEDILEFYDIYYILNYKSSTINYVACNENNDILAVMSFNESDNGKYILEQFFHTEYVTNNIYKNILNNFINDYYPSEIITFTNRRYYNTNSKLMKDLNFKFVKSHPIRKLYFSGSNYKMSLTEKDENGILFRNSIADCGTNEYILTPNIRKENV